MKSAEGEAQKIRLLGGAEAAAIEAIGKAEAQEMELKAAAYKQYGEAAKMKLVLDALPKIAAEVAAPLAKVDEIVIVGGGGGGGGLTDETTKLLAELPVRPILQAAGAAKILTCAAISPASSRGEGGIVAAGLASRSVSPRK